MRMVALVAMLAAIACGADGDVTTPPTQTSPSRSAAIGECERAAAPPEKVAIVPHGERLEAVIEPIRDALTKAIDHTAAAYSWTPTDPICVHVFPGDSEFINGLERLGGLDKATAKTYQAFLGTISVDIASGRDAIYLNSAFPRRMPFLATHEFFHIVQNHVEGAGLPTWFLEGVADWEALQLQDPPLPNWLTVLQSDQRAGRAPSLASLATWEQWRHAVGTDNPAAPTAAYNKARAAAVFLEEIAGAGAARDLTCRNVAGGHTEFDATFREVTALSVTEFEMRLDAWIVETPAAH